MVRSVSNVLALSKILVLGGVVVCNALRQNLFNFEFMKLKNQNKLTAFMSKPGDAFWNRPGPWDEPNLDSLLSANKKWSQRIKQTAPEFFEGYLFIVKEFKIVIISNNRFHSYTYD